MTRLLSRSALAAALCLMVAACGKKPDDSPIIVSAIGNAASRADPDEGPLRFPEAVTMDSTAQGLVRFDANGQVEPGLAERWIVIDDGTSYIFRLDDATWPDGTPVDARQVARVLARAIAPGSDNALAPFLKSIDQVVAMTPQVVEVQLSRPRPDLLRLLAQPEMAVFRGARLAGTGPFRMAEQDGPIALRRVDEARSVDDDSDDDTPSPETAIRLRGERASLALIRYREHRSDLVLGGTFVDWPTAVQSGVVQSDLQVDPAAGLFGLRFASHTGFFASAPNRAALAMAIDRKSVLGRIRGGWDAAETILPEQLDSAQPPTSPDWAALDSDTRISTARSRVAAWKAAHKGSMAPVRIALPDGPGANLLWTGIGPALNAIGLPVLRVPIDAPADLVLVDAVAPLDSASWYLRTACANCDDSLTPLLDAARTAPDGFARAQRLSEADAAITAASVFIPLARPLRWSVVGKRIDAFQRNSRAWHPLNHLVTDNGS